MEKFDQSYIRMAAIWAANSYCKRRQVGALLVKDRMIISDGYNGTPSGFENNCEDENGQCNHKGGKIREQQSRSDIVRDCRSMSRMLETDYSGRY